MRTFYIFLLLLLTIPSFSQKEESFQGNMTLVEFSYGYSLPGGDLLDRFGGASYLNTGVSYLWKSNFQLELKGGFLFGTNVKEDVLSELRQEQNLIIGNNGTDAVVFLRERGINISLNIGKVFNFRKNSRSGIKFSAGVGILQHWIRVQDDLNTLPQINNEYLFGYDRKTRGVTINEFLGYQVLANNQRLNFNVGVEFTQGFTNNIRNYNFGSDIDHSASRLDLLITPKIGLILSFYKFDQPDEIFY